MPPGTLVSYTVSAKAVVDVRRGYNSVVWSPLWEEFYCDWRELWFNQRVEPPSWVLADEALAAGAKGILFASRIAAGGMSLVLYSEMLSADDALRKRPRHTWPACTRGLRPEPKGRLWRHRGRARLRRRGRPSRQRRSRTRSAGAAGECRCRRESRLDRVGDLH